MPFDSMEGISSMTYTGGKGLLEDDKKSVKSEIKSPKVKTF
jgi:hypothetical protein